MEQATKNIIDDLKTKGFEVIGNTNVCFEVAVDKMTETFGNDLRFNQETLSFEYPISSNMGDLLAAVSRNYDRGVVTEYLFLVVGQQRQILAQCVLSVTGNATQSIELFPDEELRTKIRGWFNDTTDAIWSMFVQNPSQPQEAAPVEAPQPTTDIPHVDAEVISEQH